MVVAASLTEMFAELRRDEGTGLDARYSARNHADLPFT